MKLPEGVEAQDSSKVCRLIKSLYGLEQASRQWHPKPHTTIISYGFHQSLANHILLVKFDNDAC